MKFVILMGRAFLAEVLIGIVILFSGFAALGIWTPGLLHRRLSPSELFVGLMAVAALIVGTDYFVGAWLIKIRPAAADEEIERYLGDT